jgi:hypothetical protein
MTKTEENLIGKIVSWRGPLFFKWHSGEVQGVHEGHLFTRVHIKRVDGRLRTKLYARLMVDD